MNCTRRASLLAATFIVLVTGCANMPETPMPHAAKVDIDRFMGDWYVIATIPTRPEREAFNAVESYARNPDGSIATTFTFNKGAPDGPLKTMTPTGFVRNDPSNAIWGMQFIWPIKAEYVIAHVDANYRETIVARSKRDYVWIMARTPLIAEADYLRLVAQVRALGYDPAKLRKVPQRQR